MAWLHSFNRFYERFEQWTIVFHPVSRNMNDDHTEAQFFEIVLVLKTLIDGHENVTLPVGLSHKLLIGKGSPLGFRDGYDFVVGKSLLETRVNALI